MTTDTILESKVDDCVKMLEQHEEWLNGNGKPGAKTTLALIQADLKIVKSQMKSFTALGGAILVAVLIDLALRVIGKVY